MITNLIGSRISKALAAVLLVSALILSACDSSQPAVESTTTTTGAGTTTTLDPDAKVVFGQGTLPNTVPTGFPIPAQSVVGSTMIDRTRSLTEFVLTLPANVDAVALFFDENLPARGYEISNSSGTDGEWEIEFAGEGIEGSISLTTAGAGLTYGAFSFVEVS